MAELCSVIKVCYVDPDELFVYLTDPLDDDTDDDAPIMMGSGDEVGMEDLLLTITTSYDGEIETLLFNSPFPCKIVELNGEVEDNPDLLNDDAYGDGWCVIVQPHDFDEDQFLDQEEYIEMLNELP